MKNQSKECIICWATFQRKCTSNKARENQKHCSKACNVISLGRAWSAYNKAKTTITWTKKCVICWKEFSRAHRRWLALWNKQITCSCECARVYRSQQPYKKTRRFAIIRNGNAWENRRIIVLARDNFTCKKCWLREPDIMEVDHIQERAIAPELKNRLNNLQTLCPNCHAKKTRNESQTHKKRIWIAQLLQDNPEFLKELIDKN